jgi:hypothetical protein
MKSALTIIAFAAAAGFILMMTIGPKSDHELTSPPHSPGWVSVSGT